MEISNVQVHLVKYPGETKAFASATFGKFLTVNHIRVIHNGQFLSVQMPKFHNGDRSHDIVHPVNEDVRDQIAAAVLRQYQMVIRSKELTERVRI